jgi:regulatory protein
MISRKNSLAAGPEKLLNRAIKLLSLRPRSAAELKQRGLAAAIPKLVELGLIDDQKFAHWWVEQRCRLNPRGNLALRIELKQKGIDQEIIESVLLPKEQEIKLAKKLLAKKRPADKAAAQRLLLSRGFSPEIVYSFFRLTSG